MPKSEIHYEVFLALFFTYNNQDWQLFSAKAFANKIQISRSAKI